MRISDWSSDVCSSDLFAATLGDALLLRHAGFTARHRVAVAAIRVAIAMLRRDQQHVMLTLELFERVAEQAEEIVIGLEYGTVESELDHRLHLVDRGKPALVLRQQIRSEEHTSELQSLMRTSYA